EQMTYRERAFGRALSIQRKRWNVHLEMRPDLADESVMASRTHAHLQAALGPVTRAVTSDVTDDRTFTIEEQETCALVERARHDHAELSADDALYEPSSGHEASIVDGLLLRALIARLPESERDVIELRFMEDLDVEQTALRLGKQPGAVRVAQHRALTKLRTMIHEDVP